MKLMVYGIGDGKYIPYEMLYVTNQVPTALQTVESQEFYVSLGKREVKPSSEASKSTESSTPPFECSKLGCNDTFESFAQLEPHLDVGKNTASRLNQYDVVRRDWALKFSCVDITLLTLKCIQCLPGDRQRFQKSLQANHLCKQVGP